MPFHFNGILSLGPCILFYFFGVPPPWQETRMFVVVVRSASRAQAVGSVSLTLMLSNSQSLKYVPEAKALSQPHSIKPARLETRFSGDCSGNRLLIGLTGAAARCRSRNRLGSPCKRYCLELFINQPDLFINWPELLINQPDLSINWAELPINWAELFINGRGVISQREKMVILQRGII